MDISSHRRFMKIFWCTYKLQNMISFKSSASFLRFCEKYLGGKKVQLELEIFSKYRIKCQSLKSY